MPSSLPTGARPSQSSPRTLPIAWYSFDGSAQDCAGGAHHGITRGGPVYSSDVPPQIGTGKSLIFDGIDDYVSASLDVSETEYTLSIWFKADFAPAIFAGKMPRQRHSPFAPNRLPRPS